MTGSHEVRGSNPLISTKKTSGAIWPLFLFLILHLLIWVSIFLVVWLKCSRLYSMELS